MWSPVVFPLLRYYDGIILCSGELQSQPPERPGTCPEGRMRSTLPGTYLERGSVHACILLCTRGYTVVYTRVYFTLLGSGYILGTSSHVTPNICGTEWVGWGSPRRSLAEGLGWNRAKLTPRVLGTANISTSPFVFFS